jgi:predicted nucleotidyltransferase
MSRLKISVAPEVIAAFCKRWRISEFAVFGSALRDDFTGGSDVDVAVEFEAEAAWSLADVAVMAAELEELFGRPVDILEKKAIRNPFRRHEVLTTREVLYAA